MRRNFWKMKIICGFDRPSFFLFRMPWLRNLWMDAATAPFYILFLLKINKRTVPALTCPYNYRHRMMTILFLLQAWHGYRWNSSCRKSDFSDLPNVEEHCRNYLPTMVKAEWVEAGFDDNYKCSNCNYIHGDKEQLRLSPQHFLYCGHCGAEMIWKETK